MTKEIEMDREEKIIEKLDGKYVYGSDGNYGRWQIIIENKINEIIEHINKDQM